MCLYAPLQPQIFRHTDAIAKLLDTEVVQDLPPRAHITRPWEKASSVTRPA